MKNLKDYFSSPKVSDVSLNDSVNERQCKTPEEKESLPAKRKSKSLTNRNSKRKKLSLDNAKPNESTINTTSQSNSPVNLNDSPEDFVESKKKKRKSNSRKSLNLKKSKSNKRLTNSITDKESVNSAPLVIPNSTPILNLKQTFFAKNLESKKENDTILENKVDVFDDSTKPVDTFIKHDEDNSNQNLKNDLHSSIKDDEINIEGNKENSEVKKIKKKRRLRKGINKTDVCSSSKESKEKPKKANDEIISNESSVVEVKENRNDEKKENGGTPTSNEGKKSLLNYFNKVDKTLTPVRNDKHTIKVEAVIHEPKSNLNRPETRLHVKKKVKRVKKPDFDLITMEEDSSTLDDLPNSTPDKTAWKMRISFQTPCNENSMEEDYSMSENSFLEGNGSTTTGCDDVIFINDESNSVTDDIHNGISKDSGLAVEMDSSSDVQIMETPLRNVTPTLKGAKTLSAYFGAKTNKRSDLTEDVEKMGKVEEKSLATQLFLQSPAPSSIKRHMDQSISEIKEGVAAPFPPRSHIRQKDRLSLMWNLSCPKLKLKPLDRDSIKIPTFTTLCDPNRKSSPVTVIPPTKFEISAATKQLKNEVNLPIKKWLECLRAMKKGSEVGESWVEKYRPKTTVDVIIERDYVEKLSEWLKTFQSNLNSNESDSDSSGDEFINDKGEKTNKFGNTALLVGPPGVGKTATVFAAAKQNGYQVLELNASCNRNGKKVLHEFSEATQSHKVETKSLFKNKMKKKDKKKLPSNNKSLILIEDSDLIFNDQDDGYINCLSLLQTGSKRPLVLIANDSSCKHLLKLAPSRSSFYLSFKRPDSHMLGCYLKSVSLVEGNVLSQEASDILLESTGCDLRKAITNLHFYNPLTSQLDRRKLNFHSDDLSALCNSEWNSKENALKFTKIAKTICIMDMLSRKKDIGPFSCMKESTCVEERLEEDFEFYSVSNGVLDILESSISSDQFHLDAISETSLADSPLIEVVEASFRLNRRTVACDYLSCLRQMARSERFRLATQTKRNKRYFNHLNNLGVDTSDQQLLDQACSTFAPDDINTITDEDLNVS